MTWFMGSLKYRQVMIAAAANPAVVGAGNEITVTLGNAAQVLWGNAPTYRRIITMNDTMPFVYPGTAEWNTRLDTIEAALVTPPLAIPADSPAATDDEICDTAAEGE